MMRKNILLTGRPGIGKTTAVKKIVEMLREKGIRVGGMITREKREKNVRIGFIIEDIDTGTKGYLALKNLGKSPRIGKYSVLLENLEKIGVTAIKKAIQQADVIIVDEIGPMEMLSNIFKKTIMEVLDTPKPVVATIHYKAPFYAFTKKILKRSDIELFTLNFDNRNKIPLIVRNNVLRYLNY